MVELLHKALPEKLIIHNSLFITLFSINTLCCDSAGMTEIFY